MAFKKIKSSLAAAAITVSGFAPNMGATVAPTVVTTAGLGALLASAPAHAQSGKRICALQFKTQTWGLAFWFATEVSKYDIVTCAGMWGAYQAATLTTSAIALAGAALGSATGGLIYNETCEKFSDRAKFNGDICNSMQDYRIYGIASYAGRFVGMKKI